MIVVETMRELSLVPFLKSKGYAKVRATGETYYFTGSGDCAGWQMVVGHPIEWR